MIDSSKHELGGLDDTAEITSVKKRETEVANVYSQAGRRHI